MKLSSQIIAATIIMLAFNSCSQKEGSFFHKLDLKDLDGNTIALDQMKGKLIFINLWSTTCKPCLKEMPSIERAKAELEKEGYVFIAVSDEEVDRMQRFISRFDYTFQFASYEIGNAALGVYALPASYILNDQGEVLYEHVGAKEWDEEESMAIFRSYLNN
ncbi:MAG TPA: TlpA disulfide reductase family protein [Roseivirga sp.]